ncbi:MAG: DUF6391 domain-containing protein [Synechococcales bacterium]|nr:DUF6391 domain-containing protein [Synechococcales bacterium]
MLFNPSAFQPHQPAEHGSYSSLDADLLKGLGMIPGLKEILMLRQVHALEHATVWVLSERRSAPRPTPRRDDEQRWDDEQLSGLSTDNGFYLYGRVGIADLNRAVRHALDRVTHGEQQLAIHPRCGTNLSAQLLLTAGFVCGAHLLLPKHPIPQVIGLTAATAIASHFTPSLGAWAQEHLTTAIPFNLRVQAICPIQDPVGRPAHFVQVDWRD